MYVHVIYESFIKNNNLEYSLFTSFSQNPLVHHHGQILIFRNYKLNDKAKLLRTFVIKQYCFKFDNTHSTVCCSLHLT